MNDIFRKILVFDLDDTIIDTAKIKQILFAVAVSFGCAREKAEVVYKEIRDSGFTLEDFASALSQETGVAQQEILNSLREKILERKNEIVFEDARTFLELCLENKTDTRLLTYGASDWQREKVEMFDLERFFSIMTPTPNEMTGKIDELGRLIRGGDGNGVVLFNDKLKEIKSALERYPKLLTFLRSREDITEEMLKDMAPEIRERIKVLSDFNEIFLEKYDGERK